MEELKKKRKVYEMQINDQDPESGVFALSLVESPAIESNFIALSAVKEMIELKTMNEEKRLVVGAALIPNKEIMRVDEESGEEYYIKFSEQTVEKASQLYLQRSYQASTTLEHDIPVDNITVVESWIVEDPNMDKSKALGLSVPKGSWVVAMKVNNNEIWQQYIKTGKVRGLSLEGIFEHKTVNAAAELSKEDLILRELTNLLKAYLESQGTTTSISSTYPGEIASGSIQHKNNE